ncbi:MAG: gamma-glutamyl-gamma-aminobutyrate hydrolase family protein [Patescibacteria group bacterium]
MNVAIINNGTKEPEKLLALLAGDIIEMFAPERVADALAGPHDLVVLSGSSHMSVMHNLDTLAPELALIRECTSPLLGICFGAELLTVAYSGTLRDSGHKEKGIYEIFVEGDAPLFAGRSAFEAYEGHRWAIDAVPPELEVLAFSAMGPEVIRHRTKPQYGFQFHPEKMCDLTYGDELFRSFLKEVGL